MFINKTKCDVDSCFFTSSEHHYKNIIIKIYYYTTSQLIKTISNVTTVVHINILYVAGSMGCKGKT